MVSIRIPLVGVLVFQILVVFSAFIAVIAVLSIQQEEEFRSAFYKQLQMQQGAAATDIMAPLYEREKKVDLLLHSYTEFDAAGGEPGSGYKYMAPSQTIDFAKFSTFHRKFYTLIDSDPAIAQILLSRQFTDYDPVTEVAQWNLFVVSPEGMYHIYDDLAKPCRYEDLYLVNPALADVGPTDDAIYPTCEFIQTLINPIPIDTAHLIDKDSGHNRMWTRPMTIFDPVSRTNSQSIAYSQFVNPKGFQLPTNETYARHFMIVTMRTQHFKPVIVAASPSRGSVSALFVVDMRPWGDLREMHLVTGKIDFNDTVRPPSSTIAEMNANTWLGGHTPDPILNAVYWRAREMCFSGDAMSVRYMYVPPNPCATAQVFEIEVGSVKYTASAIRILYNRTKIDWLLIQYTPREEFFGASDDSRVTGIIIGVVGAVVVLVTCIVIWLAIFTPMQRLRSNMDLASEMQNDAVVDHSPLLMEMNDLVKAFGQMNRKLLKARPFLPQSLLVGESLDVDEEDEEGEDDFHKGGDLLDDAVSFENHHDKSSTNPHSLVDGSHNTPKNGAGHNNNNNTDSRSVSTVGTTTKAKQLAAAANGIAKHRALEMRRVGVLAININGFQGATATIGGSAFAKIHSALTRLVERTVGEERGIVDYFHGDRFVCGFNTARMCANVGSAGGSAAVKLWDRFREDSLLISTFPAGLSMGLSTGRAMVGNHGSDTMQRLGTMGYVFTEAMRLQELMSRRIVSSVASTSASATPLLRDCLGGRCLIMGRTLQDVDTTLCFQVLGAVSASELMPASDQGNAEKIFNFARVKNAIAARVCNSGAAPVVPSALAQTVTMDVLGRAAGVGEALSFTSQSSEKAAPTATTTMTTTPVIVVATLTAIKAGTGQRHHKETPSGVAGGVGGTAAAAGGDEWLYELANATLTNEFRLINEGLCSLLIFGKQMDPSLCNNATSSASHANGSAFFGRSASYGRQHHHADAALSAEAAVVVLSDSDKENNVHLKTFNNDDVSKIINNTHPPTSMTHEVNNKHNHTTVDLWKLYLSHKIKEMADDQHRSGELPVFDSLPNRPFIYQ